MSSKMLKPKGNNLPSISSQSQATLTLTDRASTIVLAEKIRTKIILKAHTMLHDSWVDSITMIEDKYRAPPATVPYW